MREFVVTKRVDWHWPSHPFLCVCMCDGICTLPCRILWLIVSYTNLWYYLHRCNLNTLYVFAVINVLPLRSAGM